jgi:hypothetical protein
MRPLPHLGKPRGEREAFLCTYAPAAGEMACHRDATWHGFVLGDPAEKIAAMLECCGEHLPQMKLTADFTHQMQHPCGIPGSKFRWPENECFTEWDELAELAAMAGIGASA